MAKCHTRIEFDLLTGAILEDDWFEYDGPWALLKESTADKRQREAQNQMNLQMAQNYANVDLPMQRRIAQQQADIYARQAAAQEQFQRESLGMQKSAFEQQMDMVRNELLRQHGIQDPIIKNMTPYLSGDVGFGGDTLRFMNDQAMSNISGGYDDANAALKERIRQMGGFNPGMGIAGSDVRGLAELQSSLADSTSTARRNILLENARQKLANQFNASGVLMGTGAQMGSNIGIGTGGAGSASGQFGAGANTFAQQPNVSIPGQPAMMNTYTPAPPGFWGGFGKTLLNTGLGAGTAALTGGLSTAMSNVNPFGPFASLGGWH